MDMLECLKGILEGQIFEACVLADYLEDTCNSHPEYARYHKFLKQPGTLRLQTVLDVIIKFGAKKERSTMMKIIRMAKRHKKRPHSKGTLQAFMGKKWSLTRPWFMTNKIKEALGSGVSSIGTTDAEGPNTAPPF